MEDETLLYINEANYKTKRKFQCPYCDYKGLREDLVDHIEKRHPNEIPEEWTAARVVYKVVNGRSEGICMVCGGPTEWNEDRWKYEKLCSDKCKKELAAKYAKNTENVYGAGYKVYEDPEHQQKMLNARRISGKYKFRDGGEVSYTGNYELERLKFMDNAMNYKSWEIMSPGPVIEYMMDGKKHFWITDCYILSHNLVIDDKDGGDNPNNRNMEEYRRKQLAKEATIKKQGKYNYLRLTNKDFSQLLYALADIKSRMIDDVEMNKPYETYAYINENAAIMGAFPPDAAHTRHVTITPFMMNNAFGGDSTYIGMSKGSTGDMLYVSDDGKLKKKKARDVYESCPNQPFKTTINPEALLRIYEAYINQEEVDKSFLYEVATGKRLYDMDQFHFDPLLEAVDIEKEIKYINLIEEASLRREANLALNGVDFSIGVFTDTEMYKSNRLLEGYRHLQLKQDPKGYFVFNESTGKRTPSYPDIDLIPRMLLTLM